MDRLIEEYNLGYDLLLEAIEGVSEEEFRFKPAIDKWSIHQIIIHIADSELVATQRMKKVLVEEEPSLMKWNQDNWANRLMYDLLDREQHLLLFKLLRSTMKSIMDNLTYDQFERIGVYDDAGAFTFKQLLEYRITHVRDHLSQIERVRKTYSQSMI